jgi:hypothetical protein
MKQAKKKKYCKGNLVFVKYANFGLATIENNGRANQFNHEETIYRVKSINTGKIDSFNELHFSTPSN